MCRRITAVLVAFAAGAALLATPAAAKTLNSPTTIGPLTVIKGTQLQYQLSGKLVAKTAGCRTQRTLQLHILRTDGSDTIAALTKTTAGPGLFNFQATLQAREGFYVTSPAKKFTTKSGKRVRCAAARSDPQFPA